MEMNKSDDAESAMLSLQQPAEKQVTCDPTLDRIENKLQTA